MTKEELLNSITEIGKCEDVTERLSLLTNLHDNVDKLYSDLDIEKQGNARLKDELDTRNKELATAQEYNMQMYLRLGESKKDSEVQKEETGVKEEEKVEVKSFDELAKGYLK